MNSSDISPPAQRGGVPPEAAAPQPAPRRRLHVIACLAILSIVTWIVYAPGLSGGFVFDDFPNIVDNALVQPAHASLAELVAAALSSPSSELKRPLASLSFAVDFLIHGLDAPAMRATNVVIHLVNGWLVFALVGSLLAAMYPTLRVRERMITATLVALAWLTLPINLTAVLYIVQRMESAAECCVLAGLYGYLYLRLRMRRRGRGAIALALILVLSTAAGVGFKETAVLLPLYAFAMEWLLFGFRNEKGGWDARIVTIFVALLLVPMIAGGMVLAPRVLSPEHWATRDFTLTTRLLSEPRIVLDYIAWILAPTRGGLSFYHDDFVQSTGWLTPWTTIPAMLVIGGLLALAVAVRHRRPLLALGLLWYFACHTLTATVIPLELIYEHRNYPASLGLLLGLADICLLLRASPRWIRVATYAFGGIWLAYGVQFTALTAYAWRASVPLAKELAERAPTSPRAQYEYGRALIIDSHYQPGSPSITGARVALERAAALPGAPILAEQALIFLNARMGEPIKDAWWDSMDAKLRRQRATVQDDSALLALQSCVLSGACRLPSNRLMQAFTLASRDNHGSARLLGGFAQYVWTELDDRPQALRLLAEAVTKEPDEPAYRINYANDLISTHHIDEAKRQIDALRRLNVGGRLDVDLASLESRLENAKH